MSKQPVIAISSCILGQRVRYDGEIKDFSKLYQQLQKYFDFYAICPETEIGLSVPRPPVQLTGNPESPRMTGRDDTSIDITDRMRDYCQQKVVQLNHISAYVFKSKSPSCGLTNIPVFNQQTIITDNHRGLFAETVVSHYPELPVRDETQLQTSQQRDTFIQQVLDYYAKQSVRGHD